MITYKTGNLLDAQVEALVNTVNTVGVMGKGIALQFKEAFPENYKLYKKASDEGKIEIGNVFITPINTINGVKYIINFPTKAHWKYPSKLSYIRDGLKDLKTKLTDLGIHSVAMPPLGCGNGGLDWNIVKKEIEASFSDLPVQVIVFEPNAEIKAFLQKENTQETHLTNARAMLLYLLYRYRAMGEFATEFASEKLSYFLQRFGETQMKLTFQKNHYGPYSGKVRHVLYALNGKYIKGYEQKQIKPFEAFELIPEKAAEVKDYISKKLSETQMQRLNKVETFIKGFESPYGLELLSTVDFLINELQTSDKDAILEGINNWSSRKKNIFNPDHVAIAIEHLEQLNTTVQNEQPV
jgi:O-acetyl-ADP-ribose deacetylase (regulator of RNase III)/transcription termination factor NusB